MGSNLTRSSNPSLVPKDLLGDIRELIEDTRSAVARTINTELTMLYWRIGKRINEELLKGKQAEYDEEIVSTLSQELTRDYGSSITLLLHVWCALPRLFLWTDCCYTVATIELVSFQGDPVPSKIPFNVNSTLRCVALRGGVSVPCEKGSSPYSSVVF